MGLFDGWRRKRKSEVTVRLQKPKMVKPDDGDADIIADLLAEYEWLVVRRAELKVERGELTEKLDREEIDSDVFRKELMSRMQEAAIVSENLRTAAVKLTSLGYRGVLH